MEKVPWISEGLASNFYFGPQTLEEVPNSSRMEANGAVTTSHPTTGVPDQRTLALMNIYVANTTQTVNEVASLCERRVHDVDRRCVQSF